MTKSGAAVAILVFALAVFITPNAALGQDSQTANAEPASSPAQAVLESWNEIGRKLIAMAEDFPEAKYDFKPVPAERSFAEQLLHVTGANYFFIYPATGQKTPALEDPKRDQYKTKADIVAFVKKSFADGAQISRRRETAE